jgi:uncharacterized membrane protein
LSNLVAVAYDDVATARNVGLLFLVLPRISQFGGRVIHSSLSDEAEERLQNALSGAPAG